MSLPVEQKYYGKYRGEVVEDRQGGNAGKKHPGRVTVKVDNLPHLTPRLAEPCYPQGSLFIPKVGDRVWVEFEEGNPTKPIWTGILYPEDKGRPQPASGKQSEASPKEIWTRSGHVVTIDEEKRALAVAFKGSKVVVDDGGVTLRCGDTTSISIKDGTIELKCGQIALELGAGGTTLTTKGGVKWRIVLNASPEKLMGLLMNHIHLQGFPPGVPAKPSEVLLPLSQDVPNSSS